MQGLIRCVTGAMVIAAPLYMIIFYVFVLLPYHFTGSGLVAAGMLLVLVLVRVGRIGAMNASTPEAARRRRLFGFAAALALMLVAMPWPGLSHGRPWFRWPTTR